MALNHLKSSIKNSQSSDSKCPNNNLRRPFQSRRPYRRGALTPSGWRPLTPSNWPQSRCPARPPSPWTLTVLLHGVFISLAADTGPTGGDAAFVARAPVSNRRMGGPSGYSEGQQRKGSYIHVLLLRVKNVWRPRYRAAMPSLLSRDRQGAGPQLLKWPCLDALRRLVLV